MPYLKCIDESEAKYILEEVREGIYGDHTGPRSLVSKTIKTSILLCRRLQESSSRDATNVKDLEMFFASQQRD